MKIKNNKIIEATESELFDLYLHKEINILMDFNAYLRNLENTGVKIIKEQ